jgi:TRAP transporter 4TM/12TM fusion protein
MSQEAGTPTPIGRRIIAIALPVVAIAMVVYQLAYTQYLIQDPTGHRITHLGLAFTVVFLSMMLTDKRGWRLMLALLLASVVATGYFMYYLTPILEFRSTVPLPSDLVFGALVIVLSFAGTYLIFGKTFPVIAAAFVAYMILGRYIPPPFTVAAVPLKRLLMWLSASVGTDEGIYGDILGLSANYLFLFIFFGSLLHTLGGTRFIMQAGQWLGSKLRSGPAAVAVVGSSLLGTITGSTVANITITGAFTIPLMKRAGYEPKQAGAIEAASSNGGQIMPPIMGATAFVMAGYSGIPYIKIIIAAILPAILYYFGVFLYVQLSAYKMNVIDISEPVSGRKLLLDAPLFFFPLGVLVYLLSKGFTLPFVGFWSMVTLIAVALVSSIRKEARLNFKGVVDGVTRGTRTASEMAVVTALIGVVATSIKVSGLGIKLPLVIQDISHGILFIALLIAMVSSILLGMGVPTVVAYLLVAIGAVPALLAMGVPLLQAHFFPFIFAVFSHLTPPVAIGALVASQLAGAKYWPTTWEALKAAFTGFLLPFFIIYVPVLILRPEGGPSVWIPQISAIIIAISSLQIALSNYCFTALRLNERIAFMAASLLSLIAVFGHNNTFLFAGIPLFLASITWQFVRRRQLKAADEAGYNADPEGYRR